MMDISSFYPFSTAARAVNHFCKICNQWINWGYAEEKHPGKGNRDNDRKERGRASGDVKIGTQQVMHLFLQINGKQKDQ
ncbi:MAG: hypothetical protein PHI13_12715 [Methylococcales bacterium]|nr:hypothetical protein [Methylococcales bacterium]